MAAGTIPPPLIVTSEIGKKLQWDTGKVSLLYRGFRSSSYKKMWYFLSDHLNYSLSFLVLSLIFSELKL